MATQLANTSGLQVVFYARPPLTHYSQTWDIQKVLNYIDTPDIVLETPIMESDNAACIVSPIKIS